MTKLLETAIKRLRQLPEEMQDTAARALLMQIEEEPEPGDLGAIAEGGRKSNAANLLRSNNWSMSWGLILSNQASRTVRRAEPDDRDQN